MAEWQVLEEGDRLVEGDGLVIMTRRPSETTSLIVKPLPYTRTSAIDTDMISPLEKVKSPLNARYIMFCATVVNVLDAEATRALSR